MLTLLIPEMVKRSGWDAFYYSTQTMKHFNSISAIVIIGASFAAPIAVNADIYCYAVNSTMCVIKIDGDDKQRRKSEDVRNRNIYIHGEKVRVFGG